MYATMFANCAAVGCGIRPSTQSQKMVVIDTSLRAVREPPLRGTDRTMEEAAIPMRNHHGGGLPSVVRPIRASGYLPFFVGAVREPPATIYRMRGISRPRN